MTTSDTRSELESEPQTSLVVALRRGILVGLAGLALALPPTAWWGRTSTPPQSAPTTARVASAPATEPIRQPRLADFGATMPSDDARQIADWVADSNDHGGIDFVIIDKKNAALYVFDGDARLRGTTPILLGGARGDDSVPGIGSRPIADVAPHERTTPAGRFVGERGRNSQGEDIVWIDYDAAVSMHRVRATNPLERRLERLASPTIDDNRISYGCVNIPPQFYETYVRPAFATRRAIVYVLPEVKSVQEVFGSYDVTSTAAQSTRRPATGAPVATARS